MPFDNQESGRDTGRPFELYLFQYGQRPVDVIAYTNAEQVVTWNQVSFEPVPIQRDSIKASGALDRQALKIKMPKRLELPELFRVYPPAQVVGVRVWQAHHPIAPGDPLDPKVVFTGRVINVARIKAEAEVTCEPYRTAMRRTGLRRHYQHSCPHVLYGPRCRAVRRPVPAVVRSIDGLNIGLNPGWNTSGKNARDFAGGMMEWQAPTGLEPRTILNVIDENTFRVSGVIRSLALGDTVQMLLGCPHTMRGCESLHQNILNFGGMPWIPTESPFGKSPF